MLKNLLFLAFTVATLSASAQSVKWDLDKSHSSVKFSVIHMMVSEVQGLFKKFEATVTSPSATSFDGAAISFTIDAASVFTDDEKRDGHLKSPDFFDTEKTPNIAFVSTSMKKVDGKNYKLTGNLTMHGVTKPVTLDVIFNGIAKSPWGSTVAGFRISGEIDRTQFGLTWNKVIEAGSLVSDVVKINCNIELTLAK